MGRNEAVVFFRFIYACSPLKFMYNTRCYLELPRERKLFKISWSPNVIKKLKVNLPSANSIRVCHSGCFLLENEVNSVAAPVLYTRRWLLSVRGIV